MNHVKRIDEMAERLDQRERMRLTRLFGIKSNELESFSDELFELAVEAIMCMNLHKFV